MLFQHQRNYGRSGMGVVGIIFAGSLSLAGAGCSSDEGADDDATDVSPSPSELTYESVSLHFEAVVGEAPFDCGDEYVGVGTSGSTFIPADFRLYLSNIRLLTAEGEEVRLNLEQDDVWQYQTVAFLDFEDGTGPCDYGDSDLNSIISGEIAEGNYSGIRFELGIPFELNHDDAATAPPPLNISSMFWSWNAGYKFLKLDGASSGISRLSFHLGSTECQEDGSGHVTSCNWPNRAEITLTGFDPENEPILIDLAGLFFLSNIDSNTEDTSALCMSGATDPDCGPIFTSLGLPFGDTPGDSAAQTFFRVGS